MQVEQISVFIENQAGRLAEVTQCLADGNISIRALSLADTQDFGILRLIVDDVNLAKIVLGENNFTVGITEVLAVEVPDRPGGLAAILKIIDSGALNVEYMYAFVDKNRDNNAIIIFRFEDIEAAALCLQQHNVRIVPGAELYAL